MMGYNMVALLQIPTWYRGNGVANANTSNWQHDVAAITIFFCWLELMMIIGRFPTFGLYVQMFTTGNNSKDIEYFY